MSPDEQEARSRVYYAKRVLRLESGRYAVFSVDLQDLEVVDDPRECDLAFYPPAKPLARARVSLDMIVENLRRKQ